MKAIPTPITKSHPNAQDRTQVEVLSGMGASVEYIANHLKIPLNDLLIHYQSSIDMGREEANLRVAKTFFDLAQSGDHPPSTIAWMKMRAGWTDQASSQTSNDSDQADIEAAREKLTKLLNRGT